MHRKMVKSDLISGLIFGGHIRPGPDMAGYENLAGFRPGPDMISSATLIVVKFNREPRDRGRSSNSLPTVTLIKVQYVLKS